MSTQLQKSIKDLIERAGVYHTCLSCEHFNEPLEHCRLNGVNQRPPARVIASGCSSYYEILPF